MNLYLLSSKMLVIETHVKDELKQNNVKIYEKKSKFDKKRVNIPTFRLKTEKIKEKL